MLTKKLNITDDALQVISRMTWSDDNLIGYLPNEQLERNLYLQVNNSVKLPDNSFKESGTGVNTRLVYLRK